MDTQPKDLAEAKKQIDRRHEQGGTFVQAVDATSMAMIVTDCRLPDNPIVFANPAFLALTGYKLEEVIGKNYKFLYGVETDADVGKKVEEALQAKGDIVLELMLYRKDRQPLWVMQHVSVQIEDDQVKRHFASFWDIDRRVRAERQTRLSQAQLERQVTKRTRALSRTVDELKLENEKRRAAEEVLRHTLTEKEDLLWQRDFLIKEVNHRVKNTMQMASSLLVVQAGSSPEKAVKEGLEAAIRRLNRLAEVHRLLYESSESGLDVSLDNYLTELCNHLMLATEADTARIRLDVDIEEGRWSAEEAIHIALIVNEAVTNALKHAFPNNRTGSVSVCLQPAGQDVHELVITDDGIGGEPPQRPGSLGMTLIGTFARKLGGSLQTTHEGGTRIVIRFLHKGEETRQLAE